MVNLFCLATFWSPDHVLWATFPKDFSQIEALCACISHGILNILLLHHVYTVCKLNSNCLVNKMWVTKGLHCLFLIFAFPEPGVGGSSCLMKRVINYEFECSVFTKECFYFGVCHLSVYVFISIVSVYIYIFISRALLGHTWS